MVILLGLLLCAAPAAAVGNQHARAADRRTGAEALVGAAPAEAAPLDRVGAPRRLSGYVMTDNFPTSIKTAVNDWLSDATVAEATYGHISTWETGNVTDMSYLFCAKSGSYYARDCNTAAASFNEDISAWDTSGVTSTYRMFWEASAFNQDLSGWSLDSVTNFISMFQYAYAFDQELGWCVADDADLDAAFDGTQCESTSCAVAWATTVICGGNGHATIDDGTIKKAIGRWDLIPAAAEALYGHISTWETAQVTDMSYLFFRASTFDEDISAWDTSGVTDMDHMFNGARSFNRPIGGWRVDGVRNMVSMFGGALAFDQPIGDWRVDKVTDMHGMFHDARAFNQPIGNWSVGAVTDMKQIFEDSAFNQDIGGWPVDSVIDMSKMFHNAEAFDQDIGDWALHSVTDMAWMFHGATAFNQDLGDWRIDNVNFMGMMFYEASAFDQDLGWCVDHDVSLNNAFVNTKCEWTSCGVTHGICWGRGKKRSGIGLGLAIIVCVVASVVLMLAVSSCFLAGTFGSCSKHKKTQSKTQLPEDPSSDKV